MTAADDLDDLDRFMLLVPRDSRIKRVRFWLRDHSPAEYRRQARRFIQRGRRGWSDEDAWNFAYYLSEVVVGGASSLREHAHGYPVDLTSVEEWDALLARIEEGFTAARRLMGDDYDYRNKEEFDSLHAAFRDGASIFADRFMSLWD